MSSWAIIDLDRLVANFRAISSAAGPEVALLNVVKADAYGHGAIEVCRALERNGATHFAVASLAEAVQIRDSGSTSAILILNGLAANELRAAAADNLQPVISTKQGFTEWDQLGLALQRALPCHLKLNTGMNRLGFDLDVTSDSRQTELLSMISSSKGTNTVGIATHFSSAEDFTSDATNQQIHVFKKQISELRSAGIRPRYIHLANSAALAYRQADIAAAGLRPTMARAGLALYGYLTPSSRAGRKTQFTVEPILRWKSRVLDIRHIRAGAGVGYGATFRAPQAISIAAVSVGYGDGFSRRLSNRGCVSVRNISCPILGLVSMGLTLIDVSSVPHARIGDEVTLIGPGAYDAATMADEIGTIPYEVLCGISARVERKYESSTTVQR